MIQRPRNRQARPPNVSNARGAPRGRGRSAPHPSSSAGNANARIPDTRQVVSGASVSIVLKVDQPTGREVQGIVVDVLTSGNHPRGIKVRLVDGRVGRVQRMVTEAEARAGSEGLRNLGRNGEAQGMDDNRVSTVRYLQRDVREEEGQAPRSGLTLGDLLPPGHPLLQDESDDDSVRPGSTSAPQAVCPVCGQFEGDEIAVAHHVNSHFD